jgi:hypothetical protein
VSNLVELFAERFKGLQRAYGVYPPVDTTKEGGKRVAGKRQPSTKHGDITTELWLGHLSGEGDGLGIVPVNDDGECKFAAIDIDVYPVDHAALAAAIKKLKLPLVMCRTKSNGAHLYLFLSAWAEAKMVREKMFEWACALGYPDVEIFPKQDSLASDQDCGNWINIPYYREPTTDRMCLKAGKQQLSLQEFLDYARTMEVTPDTLRSFRISKSKQMAGAPPCLEVLYNTGESKFRNNAMYNFAVFCYRKFGDSWEDELEKINQKAMKPPLDAEELTNIKKSVRRKKDDYFYKCSDTPICDVCNKEHCLKRKYGVGGKKELNIAMSNLRKIDTDPPLWIVDVNGQGITLSDTQQLIFPQSFARVCVDSINILPNTVKHEDWRELVGELLANVEIIEAPADAGIQGAFIDLFQQWIRESPKARVKEEILLGQPWENKGRIYFRSAEMQKYVSREMKIERNKMWAILRSHLDAEVKATRLKGQPTKVWSVRDFDKQSEDFDVPEAPDM